MSSFLRAAAPMLVVFFLGSSRVGLAQEAPARSSARWEEAILKFEAQDKAHPPAPGQVLFVGSSSIVKWNLAEAFPDVDWLQRGFGGSEIVDSLHFFDRIVKPYRPRLVVFYAGDNDIAAGTSPGDVLANFYRLKERLHADVPEAKLIYISIKPSQARWELVDQMRLTNALVKVVCEADDRLTYLDVDAAMIGGDGKPRPELFVEDQLHLSPAGYAVWNDLLRPLLKAGK